MRSFIPILRACLFLAGCAAPAMAESGAIGVWQRDTGTARVQLAPCGDKLCGVIVWVRDKNSPTKVGMKVFYDAERTAPNVWRGKAFNPEDEQIYAGEMAITGDRMTATGCLLGRLVCKSVYWNRYR